MLRLLIIFATIFLVSCDKQEDPAQSIILVDFSISTEDFRKMPPTEFSQLPQIDQAALMNLLNRDNPDHGTHIRFIKSKKGSEFRLGISLYTPYERNGRLMSTGPMYGFEMKDGAWEVTSVAID